MTDEYVQAYLDRGHRHFMVSIVVAGYLLSDPDELVVEIDPDETVDGGIWGNIYRTTKGDEVSADDLISNISQELLGKQ